MYVVMKVGAYVGQTRDIADYYARQLIAAGSAEDPFAPKPEPEPEPEKPKPAKKQK